MKTVQNFWAKKKKKQAYLKAKHNKKQIACKNERVN